jgi:hypothetical protein
MTRPDFFRGPDPERTFPDAPWVSPNSCRQTRPRGATMKRVGLPVLAHQACQPTFGGPSSLNSGGYSLRCPKVDACRRRGPDR